MNINIINGVDNLRTTTQSKLREEFTSPSFAITHHKPPSDPLIDDFLAPQAEVNQNTIDVVEDCVEVDPTTLGC